MAAQIEGVEAQAVPGFLASLAKASEALAAIPARLEAARVHDAAFGKLIDAAKVRDAYHQRLPATEHNIAEARALIGHYITQFGGTAPPVETVSSAGPDAPAVPEAPEASEAPDKATVPAQVATEDALIEAISDGPLETIAPTAPAAPADIAEPEEPSPPPADPPGWWSRLLAKLTGRDPR